MNMEDKTYVDGVGGVCRVTVNVDAVSSDDNHDRRRVRVVLSLQRKRGREK